MRRLCSECGKPNGVLTKRSFIRRYQGVQMDRLVYEGPPICRSCVAVKRETVRRQLDKEMGRHTLVEIVARRVKQAEVIYYWVYNHPALDQFVSVEWCCTCNHCKTLWSAHGTRKA